MKHDYETAVNFKRKHAIEGDEIEILSVPSEGYCSKELACIAESVGKRFKVIEGDEYSAIVQLENYFAPTCIDFEFYKRTA